MSNSEQKGFIVYGDMKAVVDELLDEDVGELFRGMLTYFVDGTEPEFSKEILKFVFIPIKQQMNRDSSKYVKICEKNRENANKRWGNAVVCGRIRSDAVDANTNTNTNTNTNKDTDTNTESPEQSDNALSLLSYLNSKTGSSYTDTEQTRELIEERLSEGYTVEDLKSVVDKKSAEWSCDGKMQACLRPSILFGDKFEEYLNAPEPIEIQEQKQAAEKVESLKAERDGKSNELKRISSRLTQIGGVNMTDNYDEYEDLKLQAAVLEQEIDNLDARLQREAVS